MPLVLLLVGGAALAYFLLRPSSSSPDGSDVVDPAYPLPPPQGSSQDRATGAFQYAANGGTTQAPGLMLPKLHLPALRIQRQDLGTLEQNPQFSTAAERSYILAHAPRGQIPHMIVQEGSTRVVGGHTQKQVKWVTPGRGGSDTRWTNVN